MEEMFREFFARGERGQQRYVRLCRNEANVVAAWVFVPLELTYANLRPASRGW